jgi:hypothetical protein
MKKKEVNIDNLKYTDFISLYNHIKNNDKIKISKKILTRLKKYKKIETERKIQYYLIVYDDITNNLFSYFMLYIL